MQHIVDWVSKKLGPEPPEFLHGIGCEKTQACRPAALGFDVSLGAILLDPLNLVGDGSGGRVRGVDDVYAGRRYAPQQRMQQWIVRAAKHEHIGLVKSIGKCFLQVDARDLFGHRMIDPTFLDQRYKQRASLFVRFDSARLERFAVGMPTDCGLMGAAQFLQMTPLALL